MKVILVGTIAGNGGIQTHLRYLAKALSDHEIKVMIISLQQCNFYDNENSFLKKAGIEIYSPTDQGNYFGNLFVKLKEIIEISTQFKPDIYIGIGTSWTICLLGKLLFKSTRTIFHEVMSGLPVDWKDPRWGVKLGFQEVIGQSPTVAKNFQTSFGWRQTILSLPAFPEPLEKIANLPKPTIKKVELGKARAALFSRLVPHKNAFWLIQQWNFLKEHLGELHIYGTGSEELLIRNFIAEKKIGDRVFCFGSYPHGQSYVDLLSSYDMVLLPTIGAEGAPLVLLESMACGVPFVTYGVGGLPDYGYKNFDVIIVPPEPWITNQAHEYTTSTPKGEIKAFIKGVHQMAKQLSKGEINQARLQQYYLHNYSNEVLVKRWISFLNQSKL